MYYNTTNLQGEELEKVKELTSKQEIMVLSVFESSPSKTFTSHEVEDLLEQYPRSSIVRAINSQGNQ